jgi:hypothetical protein
MRFLLAVLLLTAGCSREINVCSKSDDLEPYVAAAVAYWASEGYDVVQLDSALCDVSARFVDEPGDGQPWELPGGVCPDGKPGKCARHATSVMPEDTLPSAYYPGELRIRAETWDTRSEEMRVFTLTHELGHIWSRGHTDSGIMAATATQVDAEKFIAKLGE